MGKDGEVRRGAERVKRRREREAAVRLILLLSQHPFTERKDNRKKRGAQPTDEKQFKRKENIINQGLASCRPLSPHAAFAGLRESFHQGEKEERPLCAVGMIVGC